MCKSARIVRSRAEITPNLTASRRTIVHDVAVSVSRIAWLTTVAICVLAAVLLLVSQYYGYAGVLAAVGLSAAINLR